MASKKPKSKAKPAASAKSNQAQENLRKLFLAGLGLADEANSKMHQTFNALVKKGQTKEPQIKRAAEDIRKKIQSRRKELEKKFTEFFKQNNLLKSKEVQDLMKKAESLEKELAAKIKEAAASAKKAASKPVAIKPKKKKAATVKPAAKKAASAQPAAEATPTEKKVYEENRGVIF